MLMVPPQPGQHEKLVGIFCYPERVNKTLGKLLGSHTYTDKTRYGLYLVGKMLQNNSRAPKHPVHSSGSARRISAGTH